VNAAEHRRVVFSWLFSISTVEGSCGRIVAEVIHELLRHDPTSLLNDPGWKPDLAGADGEFGIADLLKCAGVA